VRYALPSLLGRTSPEPTRAVEPAAVRSALAALD
jgi:hypothetical protein